MKKTTTILCSCVIAIFSVHSSTVLQSQTDSPTPKSLIKDFVSSDWQKVSAAKALLESRQAEAIPLLLQLLDRDERVELKNTADLIYPGAKKFYGHGWILDYDVDWISVRAGWALEDLTFQNFGFREGTISQADLLNAAPTNRTNVRLSDPSKSAQIKRTVRAEAVARAKSWWNAQTAWNRFDAILDALKSYDPVRQHWTLSWLRFGKTKCDRLTQETFKQYISPAAERLLASTNEEVRTQAKYLLEDKEGWWLKYKTQVDPK